MATKTEPTVEKVTLKRSNTSFQLSSVDNDDNKYSSLPLQQQQQQQKLSSQLSLSLVDSTSVST